MQAQHVNLSAIKLNSYNPRLIKDDKFKNNDRMLKLDPTLTVKRNGQPYKNSAM